MHHIRYFLLLILCSFGGSSVLYCQHVFNVDLNDRTGDTFKVTLFPEPLSASNNIFQFASTAPGTYEVMDIGRFVRDFKAFDRSGNEITTEHSSTNEWTISRPPEVARITYAVADLWDTKPAEHPVYPMASTLLSDDFAMLNGQAIFGYFAGMQTEPIKIKLSFPSEWVVGTALNPDSDGYYRADDFDNVVDSPFFLGKLSTAKAMVGNTTIDVYTFSRTGLITSDKMLSSLNGLLKAESEFTRGLPVNRYVFLFYFGNSGAGAWEHSYSSEYVLKEDTLTPAYAASIASIIAHEFFHVNIPLNLHSELVEHFNFVKPVMSRHLWLYEGTTEWAAFMLQLRGHLMTLTQYLQALQSKFIVADNFDQNVSLTDLGVHATEMQDQYPDIYQKGALVSTMLDIRLLQLSHGKSGLRELILQLSKEYGKKHAFSEEDFFDKLVEMTYPEIRDFIDRYIKGTDRLPAQEYFNWLGIDYSEKGTVDSSKSSLRVGIRFVDTSLVVTEVLDGSQSGLLKGDIVESIDGTPVTPETASLLTAKIVGMRLGSTVKLTVKRADKDIDVVSILTPRLIRHTLSVNPNPSAEQQALRESWMNNM